MGQGEQGHDQVLGEEFSGGFVSVRVHLPSPPDGLPIVSRVIELKGKIGVG
jgi:hypothetical protein